MKRNLIKYSLASAMIVFSATSCVVDESEQQGTNTSGVFRLSSTQDIFTRSTDITFDEGTAYQLYAIEGNNFEYNYLNNPANSEAATGYEASDHASIEGISANKFDGKTLNFYGVTNSTNTPVEIIDANGVPTCNIAYQGNEPLTDVMWAKKENQTYLNSGTIKLMFGHTLSKLNLHVMKNSDYANEAVKLQEISLMDYSNGSLSMLTGKYSSSDTDKRDHKAVVLTGVNQIVTAEAVTVKNATGSEVTPLIFPTRKENLTPQDRTNHSLRIQVKVQVGNNLPITQETEITSILAEDPGHNYPEIPFNFESNHEYDMVITVTGSSLVVTVVPRVYEWIPEEDVKIDSDVNSSMTIGGITWMDRNIGATSGDPLAGDQAWENSRGYYYQFGRNIPFYIKTKTDSHGINYAPSNGNWHLEESWPYPFIPKHENDAPYNNTYGREKAAVFPTDNDKNFKFYYNDYWDANNDQVSGKDISRTNWNSVANQPCPKGWRIPTKEEFQLIIPGSQNAGDIPFYIHSSQDIYTESVSSDPESGYSSIYIGVKKGKWNETNIGITHSIYALKKKGTNDAYYLRWHIEKSGIHELVNNCDVAGDKGNPYRNVLVISRYPATKNSALDENNVRTAAKWSNPVEQIKLPISGYIHTGKMYNNSGAQYPALIYSGSEAVYWTSTLNDRNSYTVRIKFEGDSSDAQIKMYNIEDRSKGCLIRCVRDTKAN